MASTRLSFNSLVQMARSQIWTTQMRQMQLAMKIIVWLTQRIVASWMVISAATIWSISLSYSALTPSLEARKSPKSSCMLGAATFVGKTMKTFQGLWLKSNLNLILVSQSPSSQSSSHPLRCIKSAGVSSLSTWSSTLRTLCASLRRPSKT